MRRHQKKEVLLHPSSPERPQRVLQLLRQMKTLAQLMMMTMMPLHSSFLLLALSLRQRRILLTSCLHYLLPLRPLHHPLPPTTLLSIQT